MYYRGYNPGPEIKSEGSGTNGPKRKEIDYWNGMLDEPAKLPEEIQRSKCAKRAAKLWYTGVG